MEWVKHAHFYISEDNSLLLIYGNLRNSTLGILFQVLRYNAFDKLTVKCSRKLQCRIDESRILRLTELQQRNLKWKFEKKTDFCLS